MQAFVDQFVADPKPRIEHYQGALPIFDEFGIEAQIDANLGRKVWLKSGGYLIVDQSEALTAIDVNTGRFVGKHDLEETVLRTNLEAVREIVYQLRFRNIGGLIILDLIDMERRENREKVYRALQEALRQDKAKTNILKISELGLVEMTRKRTRENLVQMLCEPCSYCEGKGYVLSEESVAYKVLREIRKDLPRFGGRRVAVTVHRASPSSCSAPAERAARGARGASSAARSRSARACELHQEQFEIRPPARPLPAPFQLPWLRRNGSKPKDRPGEQRRHGPRRRRQRPADARARSRVAGAGRPGGRSRRLAARAEVGRPNRLTRKANPRYCRASRRSPDVRGRAHRRQAGARRAGRGGARRDAAGAVGERVEFDEVLLVGGEGEPRVGQPLVSGAKVVGTILRHGRGQKITIFKSKRRKNYRRKQGHRQDYTEVRVETIEG